MKVLVTGASGFVGSAVVTGLVAQGVMPRAVLRRPALLPAGVEVFLGGELDAKTDWKPALDGIDTVIHLAARVHQLNDAAADPLAEFRRVNVQGTLKLAAQAAAAGVRRFVFMSSIKVNGELTELGRPFLADDHSLATDPYGISKREAEAGLAKLCHETGMEYVIIRPPLVYGPGVGANFKAMMQWLRRGIPLPFGAIRNQRSLVGLGNLVDLVIVCTSHPGAANQVFLVSDGEDLSLTELLSRLGRALGRPARLVPIPQGLLEATASLLGRRDLGQRLCGSLQVDIKKTKARLDWQPKVAVDEGLQATARHFLQADNHH